MLYTKSQCVAYWWKVTIFYVLIQSHSVLLQSHSVICWCKVAICDATATVRHILMQICNIRIVSLCVSECSARYLSMCVCPGASPLCARLTRNGHSNVTGGRKLRTFIFHLHFFVFCYSKKFHMIKLSLVQFQVGYHKIWIRCYFIGIAKISIFSSFFFHITFCYLTPMVISKIDGIIAELLYWY